MTTRDAAIGAGMPDGRRAAAVAGLWCRRVGIGFIALAVVTANAADDPMAVRARACTVCHGQEGRATAAGYFPRIAGKPAGYLFNQLAGFRDGRRQSAAMAELLDHLDDGYLRDFAAHFASLDLPYAPVRPVSVAAGVLARGERLVRVGDPARRLPPCAACHGERMTGALPAIPGLLGLPRDYLVAQLGAWRTGQRRAAAPDCMAAIVERLSSDDVEAVTAWLAGQPALADMKPAPALPQALPVSCGSSGR